MSRACVFRVAGSRFAVPADRVREVIHLEQMTSVPLTPLYLLGVSNLRGTILPIVDLRPVLGLEEPAGERAATLSCRVGGVHVGLAADEIIGIEEIPAHALRPMGDSASEPLRRFALGRVQGDGGTTVLLDIDLLIDHLKIVRPERPAKPAPALAPASSPARRETWQ